MNGQVKNAIGGPIRLRTLVRERERCIERADARSVASTTDLSSESERSIAGGLIGLAVEPLPMEITEATVDDGEEIRDIADRSMAASYAVSPDTIESILEECFNQDRISQLVDSEEATLLVAEDEGHVAGFLEAERDEDTATITWLHVAPEFRGMGAGTGLFETAVDRLHEDGAENVMARDLSDNAEGEGFFEKFGFEEARQDRIEIGGEEHVVELHAETEAEADAEGEDETDSPAQETATTEDGETVYIDRDEELAGESGPFFVAYTDENHEEQYSFYCGNCESLVEAVDSMDRVECGTCGNLNKPQEWDGGYL